MVIYGALLRRETAGLGEEMERIRSAERLDILSLADDSGQVFYRTGNAAARGGDPARADIVRQVLGTMQPVSATEIVTQEELACESPELVQKAFMEITPTPRARLSHTRGISSGMVLFAAAPVSTPGSSSRSPRSWARRRL